MCIEQPTKSSGARTFTQRGLSSSKNNFTATKHQQQHLLTQQQQKLQQQQQQQQTSPSTTTTPPFTPCKKSKTCTSTRTTSLDRPETVSRGSTSSTSSSTSSTLSTSSNGSNTTTATTDESPSSIPCGDNDHDQELELEQEEAQPTMTKTKTTAILDWDDTICPSTHLASLGLRVDDAHALPLSLQRQLEQLETAVINIVQEALRFGNVVIITNAEAGWVELSGRRFLPRVVAFLLHHDIKIVSARTCFESDFPDAPSSWKMAAFSHEVGRMFPAQNDDLNVLVLGDSMSERDAAHALSSRMPNSKVKTVKFVERPSIDQLMRQVQLVAQSLPDLATYASSFDVDLVVSASA